MNPVRFLAIFLGTFAGLLTLWTASGVAAVVADVLLRVAGSIGPMVHGWVLEPPAAGTTHWVWVHGARRVQLSIQLDALTVGVVPFLALLLATPGLAWPRKGRAAVLGLACCFTLDAGVLVLFPLLVFHHNALTDVLGTFIGIVVFVGAPVIIWFGMTFPLLRGWLPALRG